MTTATWKYDTIEIVGNQMCVMDADGNTLDAMHLDSYRKAQRQIQTWAADFTICVAIASRKLSDHFASRTR